MGRPNNDTVIVPKRISGIAEMIFGSTKEVMVEGDRSQKLMVNKLAKENPDKLEVRNIMVARRKTNGKPKTTKFKHSTFFQF